LKIQEVAERKKMLEAINGLREEGKLTCSAS